MGLKANICRVCGGKLKDYGTCFKCENCDTEYRVDKSMTKEETDEYFRKLNAFEDAERNLRVNPPRFDDAESEFELIKQKYPDWSAGYWGLVRAKFGIKFEQDSGGKAVPSCYKSEYGDFRETDEYKKAIALAETPELRQSYEKMAEYIARVAKEWRAEAQKYDYDVFISFKASNDSDGSETRDAREMHKLYDLLKDKGYRVFFSPVTLITDGVVGKGSEPYIFNALDKAKALIVYGSRKEYFTSTWVQNEWQRYLRAMKAGKKEKDSLLVLYEGFNPKELPQGLRRIQGIEYGISAYPAVLSALERVFRNREEAAWDREQELRRAEEEKRKAEQENAQKMQDMMAQLAAMQAELARIKSTPSAVPQSAPVTEKSVVDPYHGQNKKDFDIKNGVLEKYKGTQSEVIVPDFVTQIGSDAFESCNWIESIIIPNSVINIGCRAFWGCSGLKSIILPKGLKEIERDLFWECYSLKDVIIPNNVISIGDNAFGECEDLLSITIPSSVKSIADGVFDGCSSLKNITIAADNVAYRMIGNCLIELKKGNLIWGCNISVIPMNGCVKSIGWGAFRKCRGLKNIIIPIGVTSIGEQAFEDCEDLESVIIPSSVKSIGEYAFSGCRKLMEVRVAKDAKIGWNAFDFTEVVRY